MKKVIIGVGLGLVAASQAQAWTGGIEDMRAMQANEREPVVRIKSVRVDGWQGGKYHTSPASYQCTADGRCHDGWRILKVSGSQGVHGHGYGNGQRAQGRHARGCSSTCGYAALRGRVAHGGQSPAAAQAKRAQRQAYYAAQAQRKAQLLAQKRRAVQQAAQQRQRAVQQQRLLAAQRKAAALQQQRVQQQPIQQHQQTTAAQYHVVQQVAAVAPAPCRSGCGGWQRSASVHVQTMRAPQAHAYCAS